VQGYDRAFELLAPKTPSSAAIYVLQNRDGYTFVAVDDAESGIDGATIVLSRYEARQVGLDFVGLLSGRLIARTLDGDIQIDVASTTVDYPNPGDPDYVRRECGADLLREPDAVEVARMEGEGGVPC
jgi:hypothetical protein